MVYRIWYLIIVTPVWFVLHLVIQLGHSGLELFDTQLLISLYFVSLITLLNCWQDQIKANAKDAKTQKAEDLFWDVGFIYLLKVHNQNLYKIGKTKQPNIRIRQISTQVPYSIRCVHLIECYDYHEIERMLHQKFANKRMKGEWFKLSKQDIQYIRSIGK